MRLLVTRPEPGGTVTADALRAQGHTVVLAPLLRIESVENSAIGPGPWAGVLLTSANAARAAANLPDFAAIADLPVLAVGSSTAEAARAAGFSRVESADGDGGDLAALAARFAPRGGSPLLYLAGADRARDLAGDLAGAGIDVETVTVYRAVAADQLPPPAIAALGRGEIDGVLHFSARSAQAYLRCTGPDLVPALAPVHFCLSEPVAGHLRAAGALQVRVAARPDEAALLALVTTPPHSESLRVPMAEPKSPPDDPVLPRRPAPTLDLKATELPPEPEAVSPSAGVDPAAETAAAADPSPATTPDPEPIAEPSPAAVRSGTATGLIAAGSGAAGAVLAVLLLWLGGLFGPTADPAVTLDPRLAAMETRLRELAARPAPPPTDNRPLAEVAQRLAQLEKQIAAPRPADAPVELKTLTEQSAALGRRLDDIALESREARSRAEAVTATVADLQSATRANAADRATLETLAKRVAGLESTDRAVAEQLTQRAAEAADARALKLAVVASALRQTVERGDPYAADLAATRALTPPDALKPLESFATSGVPSAAALGRDLIALIPAMQKLAGGTPQTGSFIDRLQANAERLVRVRPVDAPEGDDAQAVLARIERRAAQPDLAAALTELAKLTPAVRAPADAWIARAEARVRALDTVRRTSTDALTAVRPAP